MVIYGRAECIASDPDRIEMTARIFRKITKNPEVEVNDGFVEAMNTQKRTVLAITPESTFMND